MLAFSMVTLFLMIVLFALQSLVLDYFMILYFSSLAYIFVGIDSLLLLYMLLSYNVDYGATKGGVQWLLYSWTLLAKLVIYYWFIFHKRAIVESALTGSVGIYAVLFFTPILYTILSFRSAKQLYGSTRAGVITIESMLHADMAVHVMVDLLDLVTAFQYADLPDVVIKRSPWLHTLTGVFIVVAVFMHAYSFPTTSATASGRSGGTEPMNDPYQPAHQGDIFLTRKHAALVAMFLVDIPLMFIRIYLWVTYPKNPGLSPFLVKNVIFLPLQAFRLNQCRLAERERAKRSQRRSFVEETTRDPPSSSIDPPMKTRPSIANTAQPGSPATLPVQQTPTADMENTTMKPGGGGLTIAGGRRSYLPTTLKRRTPYHHSGSGIGKSDNMTQEPGKTWKLDRARSLDFSHQHGGSPSRFGDAEQDFDDDEESLADHSRDQKAFARRRFRRVEDSSLEDTAGLRLPNIQWTKVERIIGELKSVREVPVHGFGIIRLLVKVMHCLRSGTRHGLAGLLDENFVLGYWKQVRIALPLVVAWASQIALVALTHSSVSEGDPADITSWLSWSSVPSDYKIFIYIASANLVMMFLFWTGTAPLLDVLFVTLFWLVRLTAFFLTFTTIRDKHFLELKDKWKLQYSTEDVLIWVFILLPCIRLLDALFAIQSAFLGRKYIYFVVPSQNRALQTALINSVSNFKEAQLDEEKKSRTDESGWVTTSSVLVFLNCRHSLAPMSFGELLIGPDLIKDVRLMDMMVVRCWLETIMVLMMHCLSLILFFSFVNLGVFVGSLVMRCIYNIFIQAIRLLSLRRYEVKILFEEIVRAWRDDGKRDAYPDKLADVGEVIGESDYQAGTATGRQRQLQKKRFISLLDVMDRYQRHGFFTSPGDLFPNFY